MTNPNIRSRGVAHNYNRMEEKMVLFENEIYRIICGPVYDEELGYWRRRTTEEIRETTGIPKMNKFREYTENSMVWTCDELT